MTTFEHAPFVFPRLQQVNHRVGRVYQVLSGEHVGQEYPSITRVLPCKVKYLFIPLTVVNVPDDAVTVGVLVAHV